ncbi:MAG: fused MFS/spermidine synthase [Flavobacteriales bacterium]|nr:fused MFS/spermidine synthase [Flavobacteriales bacterium]
MKGIPRIFLILAFVEGFAVMAVEMFSVRIISPFYGSTHTLWTSVLASTLFSLAIGYFAGGQLAAGKEKPKKVILHLLLAAGVLICSMSFYSIEVMKFFFYFGFLTAIIMSPFFILILPLMLLGSTSPIIIKACQNDETPSGKVAGIIFTVSTFGGIVGAFLFGLLIIPNWGVQIPGLIVGLLVFVTALVVLYKSEGFIYRGILTVFMILSCGFVSNKILRTEYYGATTIEHVSEGVLGQLKVVSTYVADGRDERKLLLNNISQTNCKIDKTGAHSVWSYPHIISIFSSVLPKESEALLLGFGTGSIVKEILQQGYKIDAIDLDTRLLEIAEEHFFYEPSSSNFIVDDARHYVQVTDKTYDLVILDVLKGEVQPNYMLSIECFSEIKKVMNENGLFVINFQGFANGENSLAYKSIYKTLKAANFHVDHYIGSKEESGDIVFLASEKALDYKHLLRERINDCCVSTLPEFQRNPLITDQFDFEMGFVLRDDRPILEHINQAYIYDWRIKIIEASLENGNGYKSNIFL